MQRTFTKCPECLSAVLTSFVQASGLCKVCDARRLAEAVPVTHNEAETHDRGAEAEALERMGLATSKFFDKDGNAISVEALSRMQPWETIFNDDGDEYLVADLGDRQSASFSGRAKALESAADRIIAEADAAAAAHQALLDAGKTDALQAVMNKARLELGLALRSSKELAAKPITPAQMNALTKKLGYTEQTIKNARLSVAEASRLMQLGPAWTRKA